MAGQVGNFLRDPALQEGRKQSRFAAEIPVNQAFRTSGTSGDFASCGRLVAFAGKQFQSCINQGLLRAGAVAGSPRSGLSARFLTREPAFLNRD